MNKGFKVSDSKPVVSTVKKGSIVAIDRVTNGQARDLQLKNRLRDARARGRC